MEDRVERTEATVRSKEILVENMKFALAGAVLCGICLNITVELFKALSIEKGQTDMVVLVTMMICLCGFAVNAGLTGLLGKGDVFRRCCCRNKVVMDFLTLGRSRTDKLALQQLLELEHPHLDDFLVYSFL